MTDESKINHLSDRELDRIKEQAVIAAQIKEHDKILPIIFNSIKELTKSVDNIPGEVARCKDALEKDIKDYSHSKFITSTELSLFESKLESKVSKDFAGLSDRLSTDNMELRKKINQATWTFGGFIVAVGFFQFLLTKTSIFS